MKKLFLLIISLTSIFCYAQKTGVILEKYGKVYSTEKPETTFDSIKEYKVIFDVFADKAADDEINPQLTAVTNYLKKSLQQGVPIENMKIAVIFHGTATKNVLNNTAYNKLFNIDNPNLALIKKLRSENVELYVDKKSYFGKVYELEDKSPDIKMAFSTQSALMRFESDGYQIINSYN